MEILDSMVEHQEHKAIDNSGDEKAGPPHEASFLVSAYLPLFELLAASGVCRSLRDAVNTDVLSWLNIIVKAPLNLRPFDEVLTKNTSKANGRLSSLALIFIQLYVPGCTGFNTRRRHSSCENIIQKSSRLKERNDIWLLQHEQATPQNARVLSSDKPVTARAATRIMASLLHEYKDSLTSRHNSGHAAIDVQVCPKCYEDRIVYDCPRRTCRTKIERPMTDCRGCNFCIPRCQECGGCVFDSEEIEEAVCADILCSDCWLELPKCDFCNKPYCKQHTSNGCCPPRSTGFVCDVCYANFVVDLHCVVE